MSDEPADEPVLVPINAPIKVERSIPFAVDMGGVAAYVPPAPRLVRLSHTTWVDPGEVVALRIQPYAYNYDRSVVLTLRNIGEHVVTAVKTGEFKTKAESEALLQAWLQERFGPLLGGLDE